MPFVADRDDHRNDHDGKHVYEPKDRPADHRICRRFRKPFIANLQRVLAPHSALPVAKGAGRDQGPKFAASHPPMDHAAAVGT
jgi:hypothetical protein